jgi:hypothetical protein
MDLTTLENRLRVGEILAITPSLITTKKTFTKKCYDVAVLSVFTVGISYSLYNRSSFYTRLNIFKLVIRVLLDLCLWVLSYYILIGVHFRKKEWSHLISNLKSIQTSKRSYTRVSDRCAPDVLPHYTPHVLALVQNFKICLLQELCF